MHEDPPTTSSMSHPDETIGISGGDSRQTHRSKKDDPLLEQSRVDVVASFAAGLPKVDRAPWQVGGEKDGQNGEGRVRQGCGRKRERASAIE